MFSLPTHPVFFALSYCCNNVVFGALLGWARRNLCFTHKLARFTNVTKPGGDVGTAPVSFARGQHLTKSCTPWRALPTMLSHEAKPTHTFTCNSTSGLGGRPVLAPLSSSHEAAAAFDILSPSWNPSETVHTEVEGIINKASRTIIESISSYLWSYVPSARRELE